MYFADEVLCGIVKALKARHPDCAVTLSMGERSRESYRALYEAGADRYLLRHETADPAHYAQLHPAEMSFENRMRCLADLRDTGYQVGCGFMVGSPYQTPEILARDLAFIEGFRPAMCGIGPFIPHRNTPGRRWKRRSRERKRRSPGKRRPWKPSRTQSRDSGPRSSPKRSSGKPKRAACALKADRGRRSGSESWTL